jgi:hypothetical protein
MFMIIIGTQIWVTSTAKCTKSLIVRLFMMQKLQWSGVLECTRPHSIDKITSCEKGIIPKTNRKGRVCKQGKASFDNMSMLAFSYAVLLRRVWASDPMKDALRSDVARQTAIFAAPVGLKSTDFVV